MRAGSAQSSELKAYHTIVFSNIKEHRISYIQSEMAAWGLLVPRHQRLFPQSMQMNWWKGTSKASMSDGQDKLSTAYPLKACREHAVPVIRRTRDKKVHMALSSRESGRAWHVLWRDQYLTLGSNKVQQISHLKACSWASATASGDKLGWGDLKCSEVSDSPVMLCRTHLLTTCTPL